MNYSKHVLLFFIFEQFICLAAKLINRLLVVFRSLRIRGPSSHFDGEIWDWYYVRSRILFNFVFNGFVLCDLFDFGLFSLWLCELTLNFFLFLSSLLWCVNQFSSKCSKCYFFRSPNNHRHYFSIFVQVEKHGRKAVSAPASFIEAQRSSESAGTQKAAHNAYNSSSSPSRKDISNEVRDLKLGMCVRTILQLW
jgi:hypothetical protein